ncbi:hypothetical protein ABZX65_29025 [Streptomyces sp. NPDC003300]
MSLPVAPSTNCACTMICPYTGYAALMCRCVVPAVIGVPLTPLP